MRSAWIKWARAVEHQRVLARAMREFGAHDSHEYAREDNGHDGENPLIEAQWRLKIKKAYPERWSVLLGDVLTNLRAALDHAFWAAAVAHAGQPSKPTQAQFPITTRASDFAREGKKLRPLVSPDVWALIDAVQPLHGGDKAHTSPLEVLRWLSNIDKHRFVHIVGRTTFDLGTVDIRSDSPIEVVDEWRHEGQAEDGDVLLRLTLKRPDNSGPITLTPIFAYSASIQISEKPVEFRTLASAMDVMRDEVLKVITHVTSLLGLPMPDPESFELGEEHEAVASEYSGDVATFHDDTGTVQRVQLPKTDVDTPQS